MLYSSVDILVIVDSFFLSLHFDKTRIREEVRKKKIQESDCRRRKRNRLLSSAYTCIVRPMVFFSSHFFFFFFPFPLVYLGQGNTRWRKFRCVFLIFIDFFFFFFSPSLLNKKRWEKSQRFFSDTRVYCTLNF